MKTRPLDNKIAIIAGRGSLPLELANRLKSKGQEPLLIGIEGEHEDWIYSFPHAIMGWGHFGKLFRTLKSYGVEKLVLAGGVTRPKIRISGMDWEAIRTLPQILAFMLGGDNSLLTGVIKVFEKRGVEIVGAHEIASELLSVPGKIAGRKPSKKATKNIEKAFEACKMLGQLDIGQAAVAVGGRVVAVEGIEGTDSMIERVAELRNSGRLAEDGKNGVLVKTMKPGQDMRVDLPAIGPKTIELVDMAGLAGIAVEAGKSLILEREDTLLLAKEKGIFIFGIENEHD